MNRLKITALAFLVLTSGCGGGDAGPTGPGGGGNQTTLAFAPQTLDLGEARSGSVILTNSGGSVLGPIELAGGQAKNAAGLTVPGAQLVVTPSEISTLQAGASSTVQVSLTLPVDIQAGLYQADLTALLNQQAVATLGVDFSIISPLFSSVTITGPAGPRQGDVVAYVAEVRDTSGQVVADPPLTWTLSPAGVGLTAADGRFVGYTPGAASIIASVEGRADTLAVSIAPRAGLSGTFSPVGFGPVSDRFTSDHWEFGNVAYTGTWGCRESSGGRCTQFETGQLGNRLFVWDVSNVAAPVLTDSVMLEARTVNDVKVSADGLLGIVTHETPPGGSGVNGITLLDLTDPLHPSTITRFTPPELGSGVHNVWIETSVFGTHVYVVVDGAGSDRGLRVIDVSNPASPNVVASFYGGSSFLHDVYVRDGLAFLSHWDAGLIILDVGNGIRGGSPTNPVEVSRIQIPGYRVHNAWYWPQSGYVFIGDEVGLPGVMRVIDVRDLAAPREVASLTINGASPHNYWLDEARGIAYLAWYENGVQAVDVSGDLMGQLERQARRIADQQFGGSAFCLSGVGTCVWAPQFHNGHVFLSDLHDGLRILRPDF